MPLPNFFIIGAGKSGTTSLYHYLEEHPEIYMCPAKEPAYFVYEHEARSYEFADSVMSESFQTQANEETMYTRDEYLAFFDEVKEEKAIGESTPDYLMEPETPSYISRAIPDARIMALLRNPFDAAYSDFLMKQRDGLWQKDKQFLDVLKAEDLENENLRAFPSLIRTRLYHIGVKRYFDSFSPEQIRIFLFEDLENPRQLLDECFKLLQVSRDFEPDVSIKYNTSSSMSSSLLMHTVEQKLSKSLKKNLKMVVPSAAITWYQNKRRGMSKASQQTGTKCPPEAKEYLRPLFVPSILKLQDLIKRDLAQWLE